MSDIGWVLLPILIVGFILALALPDPDMKFLKCDHYPVQHLVDGNDLKAAYEHQQKYGCKNWSYE